MQIDRLVDNKQYIPSGIQMQIDRLVDNKQYIPSRIQMQIDRLVDNNVDRSLQVNMCRELSIKRLRVEHQALAGRV